MALTGHVVAGQRLIHYLRRHHVHDTGDFTRRAGDRSSPGSHTYFNAWLVWGLHSLGALDLAGPAAERLERIQHVDTGGLPATPKPDLGDQVVDWGPTALGAIALASIGHVESATRAGTALIAMLEAQPEPDGAMYWRTDWAGRTLTSFDPADAPTHVTRFGAEDQIYWYFGVGLAAFATLHLAGGETRWLNAADDLLHLVERGRPAALHALTSAKIGWGASLLWSITGDQRYRDIALEVGDDVVGRQTPDGVWLRTPQYASAEEQPVWTSLDTSIERACWLYEIARNLS